MTDRLLICTDLDRTLIPNGPEPESEGARQAFKDLVSRSEVSLAYVTGRHKKLTEQAMLNYSLPTPDYVIADVGSSMYHLDEDASWAKVEEWDQQISTDWSGHNHADLKALLSDLKPLRLQETHKQNTFKLSFYVPLQQDRAALEQAIQARFAEHNINANLIWSIDEPACVGLLDILPVSASKYHALDALMKLTGFDISNTVFSGDSGNDLEVMASPILSTLVANSQPEVKASAVTLAKNKGHEDTLYIAQGLLPNMNGNYSGGILEGIVHYFSYTKAWL